MTATWQVHYPHTSRPPHTPTGVFLEHNHLPPFSPGWSILGPSGTPEDSWVSWGAHITQGSFYIQPFPYPLASFSLLFLPKQTKRCKFPTVCSWSSTLQGDKTYKPICFLDGASYIAEIGRNWELRFPEPYFIAPGCLFPSPNAAPWSFKRSKASGPSAKRRGKGIFKLKTVEGSGENTTPYS